MSDSDLGLHSHKRALSDSEGEDADHAKATTKAKSKKPKAKRAKGEKKKKAGPRTFITNISALCKRVHGTKLSLSLKSKQTLDSMAIQVIHEVCRAAESARKVSKRQTVTEREVKAGLSIYIDKGGLLTAVKSDVEKALTRYSHKDHQEGPRSKRAGLDLSVSHTENLMRKVVASKVRVGDKAAVALAAITECVLTSVIQEAGAVVLHKAAGSKSKNKSKKPRIKVAHISVSIAGSKVTPSELTGKDKRKAEVSGNGDLQKLFGQSVYLQSM
ncbi:hypothetical protein JKP88DRAFT_272892 [Tribonema minus]|uniref:Histone H2B n=1 Tax=Tribonema minus TaxID=303371 RepID=A0A835YWG1_9STRA|nr:hypothetical protein JKP88DRAFT_272892 [Tribonema minus]